MYEIKAISAVKKDLKKLSLDLVMDVKDIHFNNIRNHPFESCELGYSFKGLRSYHFNFKGKAYRIVYEVFSEDRLIVVILVGPRENFYEKLKRRKT